MDDVIDTHIHLSEHYSGGLKNSWHPKEAKGFQKACKVMKRGVELRIGAFRSCRRSARVALRSVGPSMWSASTSRRLARLAGS